MKPFARGEKWSKVFATSSKLDTASLLSPNEAFGRLIRCIYSTRSFEESHLKATPTTMEVRWQDHIVSTAEVLKGKPRIKDTRIPASLVLGYLASGATVEDIIEEYPDLTKEDIAACLSYARDLAEFEVAA